MHVLKIAVDEQLAKPNRKRLPSAQHSVAAPYLQHACSQVLAAFEGLGSMLTLACEI